MAAPSFADAARARELGRLGQWDPWLNQFQGTPAWSAMMRAYNAGKAEGASKPTLLPSGPQSQGIPGSPPALDPALALERARELGGLDLQSITNDAEYRAVLAQDPYVRDAIEFNYKRARQGREEDIAGRGLAATGVHDAQLFDVNRERQLANLQQDSALEAARIRNKAFQDWYAIHRPTIEAGYAPLHTPGSAGVAPKPYVPPGQSGGYSPTTPGQVQSPTQPATQQGPVPLGQGVRRPAPGGSTTLQAGQTLLSPSGRRINVGIGGSPAYTISPAPPGSPPGSYRVTRRRR